IVLRCLRASARRFCSSRQTRSRPRCALRTRPALSITRRCFVIAWRVTAKPVVSPEIDIGPASQRRATRRSRVSSPNAANTEAESETAAFELRGLGKMLLDQGDDHRPALFVCRERLGAARQRDLIES